MSYAIVVPTYNPGPLWSDWVSRVCGQLNKPDAVIVIDSSSTDGVIGQIEPQDWIFKAIDKSDFNHGGTRNMGFKIAESLNIDYVVFLTQDALLEDENSLGKILAPFNDSKVAAVCGRQLPHSDAGLRASFAREFNYGDTSRTVVLNDKVQYGIKVAFLSDSFGAYRVSIAKELDYFTDNIIFGEDMLYAAKALLGGYSVSYRADAAVYHSHNYTVLEEFKRYFDIGVFHHSFPFLLETFGKATNEGIKFLLQEIIYVGKRNPFQLPMVFAEVFAKYFGYKFGQNYFRFSKSTCKSLSMNKKYWVYGR